MLTGLSLVFIIALLATLGILYFTMLEPIGPSYGVGVGMLSGMRQEILYRALMVFGITFLVMAVGVIVISMFYSHRITGPLYRITQFVKELAGGKFDSRVRLREKDVIHPMAEELNGMVEKYQDNLKDIREEVAALERLAGGEDISRESLQQIKERAEKIHKVTNRYRLES